MQLTVRHYQINNMQFVWSIFYLTNLTESAGRLANLHFNVQFNLVVNQILVIRFDNLLAVALLNNHIIGQTSCSDAYTQFLFLNYDENHCPRISFIQPGPRNSNCDSS